MNDFSDRKENKDIQAKEAFPETLRETVEQEGFAFLPSPQTRLYMEKLGCTEAAWKKFAESWNHLGNDQFMADGGRYRRRRYGVFSLGKDGIISKPHQPHYQSRDYNPLNGGVERWFDPITNDIKQNAAMKASIKIAWDLADRFTPKAKRPLSWHAEIHQFRIEANKSQKGQPSPEGLHRDGVDWVFVLMVNRHNVKEGTTSIHNLDKAKKLGEFTLFKPFDAALVNDHRVYHGVTPIEPENPNQPAARDVLVITLRHE